MLNSIDGDGHMVHALLPQEMVSATDLILCDGRFGIFRCVHKSVGLNEFPKGFPAINVFGRLGPFSVGVKQVAEA